MGSDIYGELEQIRLRNGGTLRPEDVVREAAAAESPLHDQFEWDDDKASTAWRLHQARNLIRVVVTILPGTTEAVKAYVSLVDDRRADVGYRPLVDVLSDNVLRGRLLTEALAELRTFENKYRTITALSPVFSAIAEVRSDMLHTPREVVTA